ncbi:MAG: gliding motility-associated C-terminal domain-containing protein [Chitinophagales bacterium]|nr:gliding motility-associated C-terminal domain-containing protein [Bacteroidota bacterium]MCB9043677.1 gliding motility-associated C-terminal domain-containing protein [Chitinophagales bacterium]
MMKIRLFFSALFAMGISFFAHSQIHYDYVNDYTYPTWYLDDNYLLEYTSDDFWEVFVNHNYVGGYYPDRFYVTARLPSITPLNQMGYIISKAKANFGIYRFQLLSRELIADKNTKFMFQFQDWDNMFYLRFKYFVDGTPPDAENLELWKLQQGDSTLLQATHIPLLNNEFQNVEVRRTCDKHIQVSLNNISYIDLAEDSWFYEGSFGFQTWSDLAYIIIDSIEYTNIFEYDKFDSFTICEGDSVLWYNSTYYSAEGLHYDTLRRASDCDIVNTLEIAWEICEDSNTTNPPYTYTNLTLYFPNAFSPNGDSMNDTFRALYDPNIDFSSFSLAVYDRYGEKIFSTTNPLIAWDGTFKGKKMPMGNYAYVFQYSTPDLDIQAQSGSILLLR